MTTEEKLNQLRKRTDALIQSVERLVSQHLDYEAKADERMAKLESHLDRAIGLIERLVDMVGNHEGRLRNLEA